MAPSSQARRRSPQIEEPDGADRLTNSQIAELLATEAEGLKQPLQKAFRRASRKALLWPEEASTLQQEGRSLTELPGIGPYLEKIVGRWLKSPPSVPTAPDIRKDFLTWTQANLESSRRPRSGGHGLKATCRCTRFGAMARNQFRKWLMPPRPSGTNILRSPIIRRD